MTSSGSDRTSVLAHQPALDGIRSIAVALVLLFHLGLGWITGGYLGVSVFFTLSGFLITSLLVGQHQQRGVVDLPQFYQRRARRLVPAGLLTIAIVCVLAACRLVQIGTTFRRDVVSAMFQVLNWTQLFGHQSYADLFRAPSPVAHFWSLGIEEQFYLLWPIVLLLVIRALQRHAITERLVWVVGGCWLLTAVSAPLSAHFWSNSAAYYATWARAGEVFAGAVVAVAVAGRTLPRWLRHLTAPALAAIVLLSMFTPSGRGWAFQGGLPLFGILSALLVLSVQVPGWCVNMLSFRPLTWLGTISYGVYLFHWPVFLVFTSDRVHVHGWLLHVVRLAVTVAAATLSFYVFERPIRHGVRLPSVRRLTVAMTSFVAVVAALALLMPLPSTREATAAPHIIEVTTTAPSGSSPNTSTPVGVSTTQPPRHLTMAFFGDSVPAWLLRDGAGGLTDSNVTIVNAANEACDGMAKSIPARGRGDAVLHEADGCEHWPTYYPGVINDPGRRIDVAVLVLGMSVALDHQVDGKWLSPCTDLTWYTADVQQRLDYFKRFDVPVVFVLPADLGARSTFVMPDDYAARMTCVRSALAALVSRNSVPFIDLDPAVCPQADCNAIKSRDGVHVDPEHAVEVLNWLVSKVRLIADAR